MQVKNATTPANARAYLLEGYRDEFALDESYPEMAILFEHLRIVYVYLSRLMKFGAAPSPDEQNILAQLQARVHACASTTA